MLKLFIETWMIQSWDWRLFYGMGIYFIGFLIYQFAKMGIISYKLMQLERQELKNPISSQLDEMYKKLDAGIEIRPRKYLQK